MTSILRKLAVSTVLAVVLTMVVAGPAWADRDGGRDDRDWRDHEVHARHWHRAHPRPVYTDVYAPPVIVSPPPVYYPPQPAYYAAPAEPSLNFIIPLHIH